MKKIDIHEYRSSGIEQNHMVRLDTGVIERLLEARGLVWKSAGLCAEPWDKYYSLAYKDMRGVTHSGDPNINACHVVVNQATSTRSKKKLYAWIDIVRSAKAYYVVAIAQSSMYSDSSGADHAVYECQEDELDDVLDIIFKHVK